MSTHCWWWWFSHVHGERGRTWVLQPYWCWFFFFLPLFTYVLQKNIQKTSRSITSCSFVVPGLQGKTKRVKPILQLATITGGPSVNSVYSVLLPAQKSLAVSVQLSFFAGKSCFKEKEESGAVSPSLGNCFWVKALLSAADSALPLKLSSDLDLASLVWLDFLAWPQTWFIMTDLLADQWPEADPDHCLQSCSWSELTNTTSRHLWVRQCSHLCCHPQLPWSVPPWWRSLPLLPPMFFLSSYRALHFKCRNC